jgi:hypothetical protein
MPHQIYHLLRHVADGTTGIYHRNSIRLGRGELGIEARHPALEFHTLSSDTVFAVLARQTRLGVDGQHDHQIRPGCAQAGLIDFPDGFDSESPSPALIGKR